LHKKKIIETSFNSRQGQDSIQTGSGAQPASCLVGTMAKQLGCKPTTCLYSVLSLRTHRPAAPLTHMPQRHVPEMSTGPTLFDIRWTVHCDIFLQ